MFFMVTSLTLGHSYKSLCASEVILKDMDKTGWYLYTTIHDKAHTLGTLQWRHNGRNSVSNHQPHDCLFNRLFRRRSKKNQSSASLTFVRGIHRGTVNSPTNGLNLHRLISATFAWRLKWPVTRKMFPFDDVIMNISRCVLTVQHWTAVIVRMESSARIPGFYLIVCHCIMI